MSDFHFYWWGGRTTPLRSCFDFWSLVSPQCVSDTLDPDDPRVCTFSIVDWSYRYHSESSSVPYRMNESKLRFLRNNFAFLERAMEMEQTHRFVSKRRASCYRHHYSVKRYAISY
jgi:hypothetical protein